MQCSNFFFSTEHYRTLQNIVFSTYIFSKMKPLRSLAKNPNIRRENQNNTKGVQSAHAENPNIREENENIRCGQVLGTSDNRLHSADNHLTKYSFYVILSVRFTARVTYLSLGFASLSDILTLGHSVFCLFLCYGVCIMQVRSSNSSVSSEIGRAHV